MKVRIDYQLCMGHGVCEGVAPKVFRLGDDAYTHLLVEQPGADMRAVVEDAVDQCPTGALRVED